MDAEARLAIVEDENERLRERVRQLEELLGARWRPPLEWRLTAQEARFMGVLVHRDQPTKNAFMAALYRDTGADEAEEKIVDVLACKIRKKVAPFGVEIQTIWGHGYALPDHQREALKAGVVSFTAAKQAS